MHILKKKIPLWSLLPVLVIVLLGGIQIGADIKLHSEQRINFIDNSPTAVFAYAKSELEEVRRNYDLSEAFSTDDYSSLRQYRDAYATLAEGLLQRERLSDEQFADCFNIFAKETDPHSQDSEYSQQDMMTILRTGFPTSDVMVQEANQEKEYQEILSMEDEVLDQINYGGARTELNRDVEADEVKMERAYKVYANPQLLETKEVKKALESSHYNWQIPVYTDGFTILVDITKVTSIPDDIPEDAQEMLKNG